MEKMIITPKTKIYDLLEAFPQLEDVLISEAPQFKKLKNPVLRKTITRVTNLNQAAAIAGLEVENLVNKLRAEVGQTATAGLASEHEQYNTARPSWFSEDKISKTIDIRDMLHEGEQPVHEVLSAIKKLDKGEILKVIAPFIPAPLLDKTLSMQYEHWLHKHSIEEYHVFFRH